MMPAHDLTTDATATAHHVQARVQPTAARMTCPVVEEAREVIRGGEPGSLISYNYNALGGDS